MLDSAEAEAAGTGLEFETEATVCGEGISLAPAKVGSPVISLPSNCAGRDGQLPDWTIHAAADRSSLSSVTQVRTGREIDDSLWSDPGGRWLAIGGLRIANRKSAGA